MLMVYAASALFPPILPFLPEARFLHQFLSARFPIIAVVFALPP